MAALATIASFAALCLLQPECRIKWLRSPLVCRPSPSIVGPSSAPIRPLPRHTSNCSPCQATRERATPIQTHSRAWACNTCCPITDTIVAILAAVVWHKSCWQRPLSSGPDENFVNYNRGATSPARNLVCCQSKLARSLVGRARAENAKSLPLSLCFGVCFSLGNGSSTQV